MICLKVYLEMKLFKSEMIAARERHKTHALSLPVIIFPKDEFLSYLRNGITKEQALSLAFKWRPSKSCAVFFTYMRLLMIVFVCMIIISRKGMEPIYQDCYTVSVFWWTTQIQHRRQSYPTSLSQTN